MMGGRRQRERSVELGAERGVELERERGRDVGPERGSGTVLALAAIAALLVAIVGGLALASAVEASHRARAGADLAALAAASALQAGAGAGAACQRAASVAAGSSARDVGCVVEADGSVTVLATAPVGLSFPGLGRPRARATARAGPAPSL